MPVSLLCPRPERRRALPNALLPLAAVTSFHRGQEIYGPGGLAEQWYCVLSGLATKSAATAPGRRQIVDFLLPGDFFGMTARDRHAMTVEAVIKGTRIARLPRRRLEMVASGDPEVGRFIRNLAFEAITRLQERLLIMGRTTAVEKVGAFLLEMAERLTDRTAEVVVLPMSRYEIADYLAMSVETVSRALSDLKHSGAIRFSGKRQVRIVDRGALEEEGDDAGAKAPRTHGRA